MRHLHPPPLHLSVAGAKGAGVYAQGAVPAGAFVLCFAGALQRWEEVEDPHHIILVEGGLYLGPSGELDDYVNHSCDPNCRLRWRAGALELWSLRSIAAGEEISFDYSTCMVEEPGFAPCACGTAACRGAVRPFHELDSVTRRRYTARRAVPRYVVAARPTPAPARPGLRRRSGRIPAA